MKEPFQIQKRIESFKYAFNGLKTLLITQHNAWIHLIATIFVGIIGAFLKVSSEHWIDLIIVTTIVWVAEALNTAMEFLCDAAVPEIHPLVEKAKDVAAGAVFISAIAALIVGILIFCNYI